MVVGPRARVCAQHSARCLPLSKYDEAVPACESAIRCARIRRGFTGYTPSRRPTPPPFSWGAACRLPPLYFFERVDTESRARARNAESTVSSHK